MLHFRHFGLSGETARNAVSTSGQNKAIFCMTKLTKLTNLRQGNLVKLVKLVMQKNKVKQ